MTAATVTLITRWIIILIISIKHMLKKLGSMTLAGAHRSSEVPPNNSAQSHCVDAFTGAKLKSKQCLSIHRHSSGQDIMTVVQNSAGYDSTEACTDGVMLYVITVHLELGQGLGT